MDVEQFIMLEAQVERLLLSHDRLKRENKQLQTQIEQLQTTIEQLQTDVSVREKRITGLQNAQERLTQLRAIVRAIVQDLQQERFVVQKKLQEVLKIVEQLENSSQRRETI
jgi:chromosome segregation ATPase